jgi:hypothetical protein
MRLPVLSLTDSVGTCKLTVVAGCGTGYDLKKKLNIVYKNTNFIQLIYSLLHTLESKNTPVAIAFVLGRTEKNSIHNKIEEERKTNNDVIQIEMLDFYRNLPFKMAGSTTL